MEFSYCKGTVLPMYDWNVRRGKWSGWKGLAGFLKFGETDGGIVGSGYWFVKEGKESVRCAGCEEGVDVAGTGIFRSSQLLGKVKPAVFTRKVKGCSRISRSG